MFFLMPLAHAQTVDDLWIYVKNNRTADVQQLLRRGLDPNTTTERGNPIIMQAIRDDSWDVFDLIMKHPKTNIKIMNGYQETPLMYVSLMGDLPRARALIKRGAEVNQLGWTPLHYAASKGNLEMVKY
ncbi:MAG: ankyrin repeat domain-containing protein, partial [Orrella sp.]